MSIVRSISQRFFYGWIIVGCGFLAQMITCISNQGLSTYVEPLRSEFGWNATQTAAGRSFQQADAFLGPINGWLADRFGPRVLMSAGVLLFALSYAAFSQIDSLVGFYAACLLMALANSFIGLLVVSVAVNHWFRQRRATAGGLAVTGYAVGGMVLIPLLVWAERDYGWRMAALASAVAVLAIGLPVMVLMRDTPERLGLKPDNAADTAPSAGTGGGHIHFTLGQAVRTRTFWLISLGLTLAGSVQSAILVHQFPQLEAIVDRQTAAFVLAELNFFNLAGRILGGILGDRHRKHIVLGFNLLATAAGLAVLTFAHGEALLLVYGALFGLGWGMRTAVFNSMLGDYFGRPAFGKIAGLVASLSSPFAIASPPLVGLAVDWLGGYQLPFAVLALMSFLAAILFFAAKRPKDPASVTTASGSPRLI